MASAPGPKNGITHRLRVPIVRVVAQTSSIDESDFILWRSLQVGLIGIGRILSEQLSKDPSLIHSLTPDEFEEFICDRLFAMGFEPKRVGTTYTKDGGIDLLFYPRMKGAFPFLGAAQVKHHHDPSTKEGPSTVREFAGAIAGHPINAGLIVTNTSFSPDAEWYAHERAKLLRLRGFTDIQRWLLGNFNSEEEWREIPSSIELCPGVIIQIREKPASNE